MSIRSTILIASAVAFLVAGCAQAVDSAASAKTQLKVEASLGDASLSPRARTIVPSAVGTFTYVLYGSTGSPPSLPELARFGDLSGATVALERGIWTLRLEALDSQGAAALAPETKAGVEIGAEAMSLSFALKPLGEGSGGLDIRFTWPSGAGVASVDLELRGPLPGEAVLAIPAVGAIGDTGIAFAETGIEAGSYLAAAVFEDSAGMAIGSVTELVRISPNLSSEVDIALSAADFNAAPVAPSGVILGSRASAGALGAVDVSWADSSTNESAFELERGEASDAAWTPLATLAAGASSYTDTTAVRGLSYAYRVRAVNDFGPTGWAASDGAITVPYLLAFDASGGPSVDPMEAVAGTSVILPDPGLTWLGHSFVRWTTMEDGGGSRYQGGDAYVMPSGDSLLFARWDTCTICDIYFDSNDGTGAAGLVKANFGGPITPPSDPSRANYVFDCWCRDSSGSLAFDFATGTGEPSLRIYARWKPIHAIAVTFDIAAGETVTLSGAQAVAKGTTLSAAVIQSFNAYSWYLDGEPIAGQTGMTAAIGTTSLAPGAHELAVVVTGADGQRSSARYMFSVTN